MQLLHSDNYARGLAIVAAVAAGEAILLRIVSYRAAPGSLARAAAAALILAACALLPLLFTRDSAVTITLLCFNNWLTSFKALLWALDRGPLADYDSYTASQFAAVVLLPLTPTAGSRPGQALNRPAGGRLGEDLGFGPLGMVAAWGAKLVLIAAVVTALPYDLPAPVQAFLYGFGLYGLLSYIMDGPGAAAVGLLGLRISPHFHIPWTATSVASFWSKHWDLAAGNTLRMLVYDPVVEGRLVHDPKMAPRRDRPLRQLLGTAGAFGTSGLVHECIFWYLTGGTSGGMWLSFFLVQVPLIAGERLVLGWLKRRGVAVPAVVRCAFTLSAIASTSWVFFWVPLRQSGVADRVVGNITEVYRQAWEAALQLLGAGRLAAALG